MGSHAKGSLIDEMASGYSCQEGGHRREMGLVDSPRAPSAASFITSSSSSSSAHLYPASSSFPLFSPPSHPQPSSGYAATGVASVFGGPSTPSIADITADARALLSALRGGGGGCLNAKQQSSSPSTSSVGPVREPYPHAVAAREALDAALRSAAAAATSQQMAVGLFAAEVAMTSRLSLAAERLQMLVSDKGGGAKG